MPLCQSIYYVFSEKRKTLTEEQLWSGEFQADITFPVPLTSLSPWRDLAAKVAERCDCHRIFGAVCNIKLKKMRLAERNKHKASNCEACNHHKRWTASFPSTGKIVSTMVKAATSCKASSDDIQLGTMKALSVLDKEWKKHEAKSFQDNVVTLPKVTVINKPARADMNKNERAICNRHTQEVEDSYAKPDIPTVVQDQQSYAACDRLAKCQSLETVNEAKARVPRKRKRAANVRNLDLKAIKIYQKGRWYGKLWPGGINSQVQTAGRH